MADEDDNDLGFASSDSETLHSYRPDVSLAVSVDKQNELTFEAVFTIAEDKNGIRKVRVPVSKSDAALLLNFQLVGEIRGLREMLTEQLDKDVGRTVADLIERIAERRG